MTDPLTAQRPRPRKRPQQARSLATVEAIVEAAARILEAVGHGGFSTNAVAERAGVSVGSLYQYFPRKEALVGALIVREKNRLIEDARAAASRPAGTDALVAVIEACVGHQLRRPALARLLDFEEARLPFDAEIHRSAAALNTLVSGLLERPDLPRQPDTPTAAADLLAIIKGMIDAAGERGETGEVPLVDRVRRAVLGYLGAGA
ncbi:TetR/AcrR family transcriptional regulator [Methylobacterium sp. WL30]|uniref:TetR/AcrR family transcriptional regulator n=1 Tax=unclassified Methylobacterium TaxID=2615210 RepID=UPI0011C9BCD5|nr:MULTISPECIES: TetR/AcrR family transcriptional regulator [unclassified Methylobacterium]TXN20237.1 TetR/AcrR family transcriptional regulator [Methylobacterium sp. WL93]TXN43218.1 TetR/AcrR family transcriptional regulator [Methylobacterium sp. WL119]TXN61168.1 TetR/AcrR family transcriptional regulator [Methylobacterium sp. WL30]